MAKLLRIKLFQSSDDLQMLENEVNAYLADNQLLTEDFIDIKYSMIVCGSAPSNSIQHYCIVVVYRKELV